MAIQKKHGKGRLDKWYKLAKEKGYRARAAFKLIQLNKKYGFLEKSKVALDLCAAPGSWCQVCAETMPTNSIIIGVDLAPIKPIPKVITFQSDITTEKCRATIRTHLKTWKADVVLHDGAPNVGTAWVQDSYNQAELALHSLKLATEFLVEGGTFVTKVFRSKDYNSLLWVCNQLFAKVEATKPPSSRNVSAEIFVVCRGFKAPKRIDPKLLDPRSVFEDVAGPAPNNEAKVYNPEIKKRKREGYEEGEYIQFKEISASEFINTVDPIAILGQYNKLSFEQPKNGDVALAALDKLPETTEEIRLCCADLKVLGRKEFKLLLKWRLKVREIFGFPTKKSQKAVAVDEEVAVVENMDEELRIQEELQRIKEKESSKKKRERRRENEKKQKEIVRMQMNMTAPMDIGMEQDGPRGEGAMFRLKTIDANAALNKIAKGKMALLKEAEKTKDYDFGSDGENDDSDEEADRLEEELDNLYDQYRERKAASDAKYRAKKARKENGDDEWEGVSGDEKAGSDEDDDEELEVDSSDDDSDLEDGEPGQKLITDLDGQSEEKDGLSKRAKNFFSQGIFAEIPGLLEEPESEEETQEAELVEAVEQPKVTKKEKKEKSEKKDTKAKSKKAAEESDDEDDFEVVKNNEDDDWENVERKKKNGRPDIDIITAEAMTLAHQLATGEKTSYDVIDDGYTKHAFKDRDGLPDWFLDDESKHDKPHKPITKAAAEAIKEKLRAYNARPIKKVAEAKARKKFKQAQRLEKLKKKADMLVGDDGLSEKEKASSISKLMSQVKKKTRKAPVKVVKAAGSNRGLQGRPKGVKGRYKMVDPRMKKELRAMKRISKKKN
ncbi:Spb1 C-terminal domain-containing protein [Pseudoneurospora amorphoporcata]|uniref:Spb1 C-terminal domain-containing protein n=1 Tax=Pseudoneurospora amorphoporcata TaxID=241081 RepID=A0AAN6P2E2_9PEZI|nr:Spb1 C-terminal domain-containing protein [Pseudoneurospora amorphoporcata]